MQVLVLGPTEVHTDGRPVALGTPKQRALLSALALTPRTVISVDRIAELVWADAPPRAVLPSVQGYVSHLRKVLDPARGSRKPPAVLATHAAGYSLQVSDDDLDARRFETVVEGTHERLRAVPDLGPVPLTAEELTAAGSALETGLALWRGAPYADLGDTPDAAVERGRLEDLRALALESRVVVWLTLGDHARAAVHLDALTARYPLRERLWALRAIALARGGRQADALEVLAQLRRVLDEELGLEPSAELQRLQTALLRQDESVAWSPPRQSVATIGPADPSSTPGSAPVRGLPSAGPEPGSSPTVGRDAEAAQLDAVLAAAARGRAGFAVVTGDPGSGKTRLVGDLARRAQGDGFRVAVGRCSQDELAPPLHPWTAVLRDLGQTAVPVAEQQEFRAWQAVAETVQRAAREGPVVVVLEDLHWASPATIRALRLLVESAETGRLLVVATWRTSQVRPTNALGDLAANLGRRHAVRLELGGLSLDGVRAIHAAVTGRPLGARQVRMLHERTAGNPYLVTEYAELARRTGTAVEELLASTPAGVVELLSRRLALLPERTQTVLRLVAVLGDEVDLVAMAAVTGQDEGALLDDLEPALLAGFVEEAAADRFAIASPVVADVLRAQVPASRAARLRADAGRRGLRGPGSLVPAS